MKSYTNIEQSKKLAEILPIESADLYWKKELKFNIYSDDYPVKESDFEYVLTFRGNNIMMRNFDIPCWSLATLINLLPSEFTTENKFGIFKYTICIRKYKLTEDIDVHQIAYGNYKYYEDGSSSWKDMINTGEKENLIDAAFDMICWLHEQKLI